MPAVPKPEKKPKKRLSMAQRRKQRIEATASEAEILALFHSFGWLCLWCGDRPVRLTIDHVIPVSRGGSSTVENLQPLCLQCNIKKGTLSVDFRPLWRDPLNPPSQATRDAQAFPKTTEQLVRPSAYSTVGGLDALQPTA